MFPKKLSSKLNKRRELGLFRSLSDQNNLADFSSNDYLGFASSETIFENTHQFLMNKNLKNNGSTGSRLLTGNFLLYDETEGMLCRFHNSEAALIFNSGYNANVGFFSSVPQRGDIIYYDEFCHASIREGIQLSNAKAHKFKHNDLKNLNEMLKRVQHDDNTQRHPELVSGSHNKREIYIVTESVFSMDGDTPDLKAFAEFCTINNYHFIVDEAHSIGVFGESGKGLIQSLGIEKQLFARIVTFGKALGCHGAAVLGSKALKEYLINFSRSFIYTTALTPHTLATITEAYKELLITDEMKKLHRNISSFKQNIKNCNLLDHFIESKSAIHCYLIPGNDKVKNIAKRLQDKGFDVKPILSPTVPKGQERLRFCLHSYNTEKDISSVVTLLKENIDKFPSPL